MNSEEVVITKKEKLKISLSAITMEMNNKYLMITSTILLLQIAILFVNTTFIMALSLFGSMLLLYAIVAELTREPVYELAYVGFKLSLILLIYGLFFSMNKSISLNAFNSINAKPLMFFLATIISIVLTTVYIDRERQEKIDKILLSIRGLAFIKKKQELTGEGDTVICKNKDTGEDVVIPFEDRFLHMLVLGPTGSGKTSQVLLPMIDQDIKNKGYGITVIEPKGDLAEKVYAMGEFYGRETIYFNPSHPDCPFFNPLYGGEAEVIENMATTFKMLSASEKSNPFFDNQNENLIRNSLKLLKRLKGNNATLIDLSTIVYNSQGQGKVMVNQLARINTKTVEEAKENGDIASWFLAEYYNERSKMYEHCSGLRSQVSKITANEHLRRVLNPPDGKNDLNFDEIIEKGKVLAISTAQGELRDLGRFLGYFIILNFQSAVFKRPGNENTRTPHFLYIDEFQTYSNPGFADMLTQGRSYKVASHLATQNRALMAMGGGKDGSNFVELVSTNARNIIFFPGGNSKDAKFYSDEFGEEMKKKREKSTNRSKTSVFLGVKKASAPSETLRESEQMGTRFSPSDLIYGEFGEISYRIMKNKTVQAPGIGKVTWLPKEFNKILDEMVEAYREGGSEEMHKLKEENGGIDEEKSVEDTLQIENSPVNDVIITFDDDGDEVDACMNEISDIPKLSEDDLMGENVEIEDIEIVSDNEVDMDFDIDFEVDDLISEDKSGDKKRQYDHDATITEDIDDTNHDDSKVDGIIMDFDIENFDDLI